MIFRAHSLGNNTVEHTVTMRGIIVPATNANTSQRGVELARKYPSLLHAAVGIHPTETHLATKNDFEKITALAALPETKAIGETGLDLYWRDAPIETQIASLTRHFELARQFDLPIILHCRDAWHELISLLQQQKNQHGNLRGVLHAFSGTRDEARICLDAGLHVSFAGSVTYLQKKFAPIWEAASFVPTDRLLIETDAPFMLPHPLRNQTASKNSKSENVANRNSNRAPNEPLFVGWTAARLAELRNETFASIAEVTTRNAENLFGPILLNPRCGEHAA